MRPFTEQAVGGSDIPQGEGVRGGVCVCVTSHLLLNPISKARGLNQPSPLKACQGESPQIIGLIATTHK